MRTIKQASQFSGMSEKLLRAVVRQLGGMESARKSMPDIMNHGIDGGFHGFITYRDTDNLFRKNRTDINALVESMAEEIGEGNAINFVASFRCLQPADKGITKAIMACLGGGRLTKENDCVDLVTNALAWFAGEEAARAFCDE